MNKEKLLSLILDSWNKPLVFVDADHIIRYMNEPAKKHYAVWGDCTGKSIFACHNENSCAIIDNAYKQLANGAEEVLFSGSEKQRVYVRGVRDENGKLIGYYERYEPVCINQEPE
ncbi:MAG: PAS domain-containing protein [Spirochaetota bacterium]